MSECKTPSARPGGELPIRHDRVTLGESLKSGRIQAAIFDLDGTLIDSMPYWESLACDYLETCGISAGPEIAPRLKAMTLSEAADWFTAEFHLPGTADEHVARLLAAIADRYRSQIPLKPGVQAFLERLKERGIRMGVATATDADLARACLDRVGVLSHFAFVISCNMIGIGKGRPDIFLLAAERLDSEPARTAVFEDALHAAESAAAAGFYVVGVADPSAAGDRPALKARCDAWIDDFTTALADLDT